MLFRTQGGFCNRLRAIVSAVLWSEDLEQSLTIYWPVEPGHMPCALEELLVPSSIPRLKEVHAGYLPKAHHVVSEEDMRPMLMLAELGELRIESYSEFHPEARGPRGLAILRGLRIQPALEKEADVLWKEIGGSSAWTGVHYRGTDHHKCKAASPLEAFFEVMKGPLLFVSDEAHAIEAARGRAVTLNHVLGRRTAEQQKAGVLDWLLLHKCGTILGSAGSSFSELAALRSGATLVRVKGAM